MEKLLNVSTSDLHMHSIYSEDGEYTPQELVQMCATKGVKTMAITDHNCVRGVEAGIQAAKSMRIKCISGIEIDCSYCGVDFHILGYNIDYKGKDFTDIDDEIEKQSCYTSTERLKKIRELGFDVSEEEMRQAAAKMYWKNRWTAEMFAEVLLKREDYLEHPLLQPFRKDGRNH